MNKPTFHEPNIIFWFFNIVLFCVIYVTFCQLWANCAFNYITYVIFGMLVCISFTEVFCLHIHVRQFRHGMQLCEKNIFRVQRKLNQHPVLHNVKFAYLPFSILHIHHFYLEYTPFSNKFPACFSTISRDITTGTSAFKANKYVPSKITGFCFAKMHICTFGFTPTVYNYILFIKDNSYDTG